MSQTLSIGNARAAELAEHLKVLIRWRTSRSEEHRGITAARTLDSRSGVPEIQQEVRRILRENPELAELGAIYDVVRLASEAVIGRQKGSGQRQILTLEHLLKPPLQTWQSCIWVPQLDVGSWKNHYEKYGEDDAFNELLADFPVARLGNVVDAWLLEVDGEISEVIECWSGTFYQSDMERELDQYGVAQCFYRYLASNPESGRVYKDVRDALRGTGGVSWDEAFDDGLRFGLVLPEA